MLGDDSRDPIPALVDSTRDLTALTVERITDIEAKLGLPTELQTVTKQLGLLPT